jgi:apolipoprotein D and lipocalin family protein
METPVAPLKSVPSLDLQAYLGLWHQQAHFPAWFQNPLARHTTAEYHLNSDKRSLTVINKERGPLGVPHWARGTAWFDSDKQPGQFKVQFVFNNLGGPIQSLAADYWIVALGPTLAGGQYEWAVVSEPSRKYAWILSRAYSLPTNMLLDAIRAAKDAGINTDRFVFDKN